MKHFFGQDRYGKIHLMMSYTKTADEVADPWYTRDFTKTQNDITNGCHGLLNFLMKKEKMTEK